MTSITLVQARRTRRPAAVAVQVLLAISASAGCKKEPPKPVQVVGALLDGGRVKTVPGPGGAPLLLVQPLDAAAQARVDQVSTQPGAVQARETVERAKAYVLHRKDAADARQQKRAASPVFVVVGAPDEPLGTGVALQAAPDAEPTPFVDALWTGLPAADAAQDGALEQVLPGRLGKLALGLVVGRTLDRTPAGGFSSLQGGPWLLSDPVSAMVNGYDLLWQVLARKQSVSGKLDPQVSVEKATDALGVRCAAVMANRYVYRPADLPGLPHSAEERTAAVAAWVDARPPNRGPLWTGSQMVDVPGVAAGVLHALATDADMALAALDGALVKQFARTEADPAPTPNVAIHLKLLHAAFERLNAKDAPALPGIHSWMDAVSYALPEHKQAAVRALVTSTQARTASTAGNEGVEGGLNALTVLNEVLSGARFPDGAVAPAVMQAFPSVKWTDAAGVERPWVLNLNTALPWMWQQLPALHPEDAAGAAASIQKDPLTSPADVQKHLAGAALSAFQAATR